MMTQQGLRGVLTVFVVIGYVIVASGVAGVAVADVSATMRRAVPMAEGAIPVFVCDPAQPSTGLCCPLLIIGVPGLGTIETARWRRGGPERHSLPTLLPLMRARGPPGLR